jgi:hypothetical protein
MFKYTFGTRPKEDSVNRKEENMYKQIDIGKLKVGEKYTDRIEIRCTKCNRKALADVELAKKANGLAESPKYVCSVCKTREKLLEDIAKKELHLRVSYDCHLGEVDEVMHPDKDSDALMMGVNFELCRFEGIRVQFSPDTKTADVIRALDKIKDWIVREMDYGYKKYLKEFTPKTQYPDGVKGFISEETRQGEDHIEIKFPKDTPSPADEIPY